MVSFEELFGRGSRSPIKCPEAGDMKPLGVDMVNMSYDKVRSIHAKLLEIQSW